jgi:hypothetical protein
MTENDTVLVRYIVDDVDAALDFYIDRTVPVHPLTAVRRHTQLQALVAAPTTMRVH